MSQRIDTKAIQKEQIRLLRQRGMGYKAIGTAVGCDREFARSCSREIDCPEVDVDLNQRMRNGEACMFCGAPIEQRGGAGRPRRFCSEYCRRQYWRLHRDEQKRNPELVKTRVCRYCGQLFEIYGKNDRKYCCREHYLKHYYGDDVHLTKRDF